jgi:8-oxo-dGTP diphosphatase
MESWDLYDRDGKFIGTQVNRGEPIPDNSYHRVVHIWILNERKEYLIQRRAPHLKWHPDKWATTTGSVQSGEYDLVTSAYRELEEELGLDNTKIDIEFEKDIIIGHSIVSIFKGFLPSSMYQKIKINDEVSEIMWAKKAKIDSLREGENFATYSDETFEIAFNLKLSLG